MRDLMTPTMSRPTMTRVPQLLRRCSTTATPSLLLVWHSRTGLARQMADAMEHGALTAAAEMEVPLHVNKLCAADAGADDLLQAAAYLFCAPENLASTSGEMLEFFHRTYYNCFDDHEASLLLGRPYGVAIAAGSDGSSAARQIERIATGWRLKRCADPYINQNGLVQTKDNILAPKACSDEAIERCKELAGLVAATALL